MAKTSQKLSEHSFESALERLEHIVGEMEADRLPLEELLGRYEEGTRLVKVCQDRILAAERRIELIAKNASGAAELSGFDPSSGAPETSGVAEGQPSAAAGPGARGAASKKGSADEASLF
jgi:exodeoxyribonuclease VII small subunit